MSTVAKVPRTTAKAVVHEFDVEKIRRDFPILQQSVHGKPLVYLDNAATTQKPLAVIEAIEHYYRHDNSNIHRGVHALSERATEQYEKTRAAVQRFLNAADSKEIIFTRGTTESINLVAQAYGRKHVGVGDEVLITAMNIIPTSFPGRFCAKTRAQSFAWRLSTTAASCSWKNSKSSWGRGPGSLPYRISRTRWAPSIRCAR